MGGLLDWLRARALADGRIDADDLEGLQLVHEPSQVCAIVGAALRRQREHERRRRDASSGARLR